jgi:hypothetical protein
MILCVNEKLTGKSGMISMFVAGVNCVYSEILWLLLTCPCAYRTFDAALGHFFVFFGCGSYGHVLPPELNCAMC